MNNESQDGMIKDAFELDAGNALARGWAEMKDNFLVFLLAVLVTGLIGIGLIVFIFPGIYVACRLAFVPYLVMDEGLDPIAAVEASWRITRGHAWRIFVLEFLSIFIFFLGLLLLIVGMFPAMIWTKASLASLYLTITGEQTVAE